MNKKQPEIKVKVFNSYVLLGFELPSGWFQPLRRVYRSRSKYAVPHQSKREKERRKYVTE